MPKASYKLLIYQNNVAAVRYSGSLDGMVTEKAIQDAIDRNCISIVVDMTDVTFASSAGVGSFLAAQETLQRRFGQLVFVQPPEQVRIILQMMGFFELFTFYDSLELALRTLILDAGSRGESYQL